MGQGRAVVGLFCVISLVWFVDGSTEKLGTDWLFAGFGVADGPNY